MTIDYKVTEKASSLYDDDQGGRKFVDVLVRELDEEDEILNEYTCSFSFQAPEEVEDKLLQVLSPMSIPEGVEDNIIREAVNLAHSLENDTINKAINVKVIIRPQDLGESDSDEEEYELLPEEPTPASEEAIEALEILTLDAPEECAICSTTLHVDESGTRLPCYHTYHYNCIVHWLHQKNTCPQCRHQLPTDLGN